MIIISFAVLSKDNRDKICKWRCIVAANMSCSASRGLSLQPGAVLLFLTRAVIASGSVSLLPDGQWTTSLIEEKPVDHRQRFIDWLSLTMNDFINRHINLNVQSVTCPTSSLQSMVGISCQKFTQRHWYQW